MLICSSVSSFLMAISSSKCASLNSDSIFRICAAWALARTPVRQRSGDYGKSSASPWHCELDAFQYLAEDTNSGLIEHEYIHVLHGIFNGEPRPNPDEVGAYRRIAPSASYWRPVQNGSRRGSRCWRINIVPNPCSQNGRRKIG